MTRIILLLSLELNLYGLPTIGTSVPSSGNFTPGTWYSFTYTASESTGYQYITETRYLFDHGPSGVDACYLQIKPNSNQIFLLNDAGTVWGTAITPGSGSTLTNSQCSVRGTGSSISNSGTTTTITFSVSFATNYTGSRYLWIWLANSFGQNTSGAGGAWPMTGNAGQIQILGPPVTVSVVGLSGDFNVGVEQTVTAKVRDPNGYADITNFNVLLNYGVDGYWSCYCLVYPNGNYFHLLNDAGDSWGPAYTFGVAGTAANSSCKVNAATSSRSVSGTDATAIFKITFLPGVFSRPSRPISAVNSYLYVTDNAGATAGWNGPYQTSTARSGPKLIVTSQR